MSLRILAIGGTGLISGEFASACAERGDELTLINRGASTVNPAPASAKVIHADARDANALRGAFRGARLRGEQWDAVVQFVAYRPEQVADDVATFAPLAKRYVLISTGAAYAKPGRFTALTEDHPQENPHWEYARLKAECERVLIERATAAGLGYTIVRPAHTYGDSKIPAFTGNSTHPWTIVDRMRKGADIVIPGDGTALWTVTHASDVAAGVRGLLDTERSLGRAVHITSDEALTWRALYGAIASAAGLDAGQFESQAVSVPSDSIIAAFPEQSGSILGDKMHSAVYDNSLIKELVPGWSAAVGFAQGVARAVEAFERNPDWQTVDAVANARFDALGRIYRAALRSAAEQPGQRG